MVASLTFLPFILNGSIVTLTSLDFLGFGMPPGSPSLGELVAQGKANLHAPWLGITAFSVLAVLLSLLIFVFEGVRDAFDPRKTGLLLIGLRHRSSRPRAPVPRAVPQPAAGAAAPGANPQKRSADPRRAPLLASVNARRCPCRPC